MQPIENPSPRPQDHYSQVLDSAGELLQKGISSSSVRLVIIDLLKSITEEHKKYIDGLIAINNTRGILEIVRSPEKFESQNRQRDYFFLLHAIFLRFLRDNIAAPLEIHEMKNELPDSWFSVVYIQYFLGISALEQPGIHSSLSYQDFCILYPNKAGLDEYYRDLLGKFVAIRDQIIQGAPQVIKRTKKKIRIRI